jgi:hypothetical protein
MENMFQCCRVLLNIKVFRFQCSGVSTATGHGSLYFRVASLIEKETKKVSSSIKLAAVLT